MLIRTPSRQCGLNFMYYVSLADRPIIKVVIYASES